MVAHVVGIAKASSTLTLGSRGTARLRGDEGSGCWGKNGTTSAFSTSEGGAGCGCTFSRAFFFATSTGFGP